MIARRQSQIGRQVSARGEGAGRDCPCHDGRSDPSNALKLFKPLTFDFRRWILRIGQIPFLLDRAQLVFDHIEASIFALWFGAQAGRKGVTFRCHKATKINPYTPQPRFDVADTLGKQKSLDPIDMGSSFLNKPISLAMRPSGVLLLNAPDPDNGADMTFTRVNGNKGVQPRRDIDPIRLYPSRPSVHLE